MICVVRVGRAAAGGDVGCFGVVDEQDWGGREAERAEVWLGVDRVSSLGLTILPFMQFFSCHIFYVLNIRMLLFFIHYDLRIWIVDDLRLCWQMTPG